MKYIDLHADTILNLLQKGEDANLKNLDGASIDFDKLREGKNLAQCFAVWLPDGTDLGIEVENKFSPKTHEEDMDYIRLSRDRLFKEVENNKSIIELADNKQQILLNESLGKQSAILTMEDGRAVDGKMENLRLFREMGFRMMAILWNKANCFGFPSVKDANENQRGLTNFGKEAIPYMEELGIIVDVSHLSDGGIQDVLDLSTKPIVASHSNAKAICNHQRNLKDEYIKGIAESGGVIGLCFSPRFLREDGDGSRIEDMIKHLNHIYDVGGQDVLAIGTDFDGTWGEFDIENASQMQKLFSALEAAKWPISRIESLAYKNALRVFE